MTEITVIASKYVNSIYVEMSKDYAHNIQGTIQVFLETPDGMQNTTISNAPIRRELADTTVEIQAAVEVLTAAVLAWEAEDIAAATAVNKVKK